MSGTGSNRTRFETLALAPVNLKVGLLPNVDVQLVLEPYVHTRQRLLASNLTSTASRFGAFATATEPAFVLLNGFLKHEGCPSNGSFTFDRSVAPGLHEIAIRGRDRGGQAYLDAKVEVVVPPT